MSGISDFRENPAFQAGLSQILDLTDVTEFERDFAKIMSLQATQVEALTGADAPAYFIFIAPNELTQAMANSALKSWREIDAVVPLVLNSLQDACDVLGLDISELADVPQKVT
ncbi:hypothetical protein [Shimia biformata]|uniref:hypothetical protein n=1 Tax=Shimia biformata TaxID=1294299 RepID=UPI0019528BFF|nr:hypothetical protein [Shimia biformata]